MSTQFIALEEIRVATPCRADWNKMQGDDKTRFCGSCAKNVYNLSSMTRSEAETLVREKEGELCVRFFQRADGTMLTTDCPVGTKPNRRAGRVSVALLTIAVAPFLLVSAALAGTHFNKAQAVESLRSKPLIGALVNKLNPQPVYGTTGMIAPSTPTPSSPPPPPEMTPDEPIMGDVAVGQTITGNVAFAATPTPQPIMGKPKVDNFTVQMGEPTMGAPIPPKQCPPK